jgi:hypothetical protein
VLYPCKLQYCPYLAFHAMNGKRKAYLAYALNTKAL